MSKHITDEAVEAAVKAWDHHWGDRYGDEALEEMGEEVRIALEAAAPLIAAKALEDAADAFEDIPVNKGATISTGTSDWFELFPVQHIRARAEDIRTAK